MIQEADHSAETVRPLLARRAAGALADPELIAAQRGLRVAIVFSVDGESVALATGSDGVLGVIDPARAGDGAIRIAGDALSWAQALSDRPPPGFQSFTAIRLTNPAFRVDGDPLLIAQSLQMLERLFELLKPAGEAPAAPSVARDDSLIEGRYATLTREDGVRAKIYYEAAGRGLPLVMLHTAGADSRQYQAVLSDSEFARSWRMYAFDMPSHGRSWPAEDWSGAAHRLTQDAYLAWCTAFIEQIVGEPAVIMGCSMGAAMSLVLAARAKRLVRGTIALEAPLRAPGRINPFLVHAAVNESMHSPSYVRGLMSPLSPLRERRRAAWIYSQGASGVYAGDLAFYSDEFDGERIAAEIGADHAPIYMLTGEYDYSASPESTRSLAAKIPGARFQEMRGLGHFPMCENPDLFRSYLGPVLDDLRTQLEGSGR